MTPNIITKCNNAPSKPKLKPLIRCIRYQRAPIDCQRTQWWCKKNARVGNHTNNHRQCRLPLSQRSSAWRVNRRCTNTQTCPSNTYCLVMHILNIQLGRCHPPLSKKSKLQHVLYLQTSFETNMFTLAIVLKFRVYLGNCHKL